VVLRTFRRFTGKNKNRTYQKIVEEMDLKNQHLHPEAVRR
jgi:hypothetical protein